MKPLWTLLLLSSLYFNSFICDDNSKVIETKPNNKILVNNTASGLSLNSTLNKNNPEIKLIQEQQQPFQSNVVAKPSQTDYDDNYNIPGGFFTFMALGFVVIIVIIYKTYRGRFSRAERRYGVQGQQGTQELTPLPLAIEDDDSENDDQTLFDIHQQLQARDNFVL